MERGEAQRENLGEVREKGRYQWKTDHTIYIEEEGDRRVVISGRETGIVYSEIGEGRQGEEW